MIRGFIVVPLLAGLAACAQLGLDDGFDRPHDSCGAGKLNRFIGVPAGPEVLADIALGVGERNIRTIRPGEAVTMDFRPERLNIEIGAGGRIERLRCG